MKGLTLLVLMAMSILGGCYHPGDCTDGEQRCQDNTPQYCSSYGQLSKDLGSWISGTPCGDLAQVCKVDQAGQASCVNPP